METEETEKFTEIFENDEPFEMKSRKFNRCLKQTVKKCFKNIRVKKSNKETEIDLLLKQKRKLTFFNRNSHCGKSVKLAQNKLDKLDEKVQKLSSARNIKIVEEHIQSLKSGDKFSQSGMWKLRKKLHPSKQMDPPMAKKETKGNLITAPPLIRKLYLDTYVDRLSHRKTKKEFEDVYNLKTELWTRRLERLRTIKSPGWNMDDLNQVLKKLKNNKSRDPHGYINELFKPD